MPHQTLDQHRTAQTRSRYNRIARLYDLLESSMAGGSDSWHSLLWSKVPSGRVLEVGIGTGRNLPHHPPESSVYGLDLSEKMLRQAHHKIRQANYPTQLLQMDAQQLAWPNNSFDAVIATCVFCSVPDPVMGLRELGRVVKPEGKILLLEHMRLDYPVIGRLMDWLNPLVVNIVGANINRQTVENVRRAGLKVETLIDLMPLGLVKLIVARP